MDGWKWVPVEPTEEMLIAFDENCDGLDPEIAQSQWQKILAAAPVPPAGLICDEVAPITEQAWRSLDSQPAGEVEVLKVQYRVSAGPQTGWSFWGEGNGDEFRNSYQVEVRELVDRAHVTRLTAENARLQADLQNWKRKACEADERETEAQSELTKARELFADLVSSPDAIMVPLHLWKRVQAFAHQSAPAAKGGE